jgi:hypothetical protein
VVIIVVVIIIVVVGVIVVVVLVVIASGTPASTFEVRKSVAGTHRPGRYLPVRPLYIGPAVI